MKTEELVGMLATGLEAIEPHAAARRYAVALGWGACAATLMMAILLGVRPDLPEAARLPMFWVKLAFAASLAAASLLAVLRLSRPGASLARLPGALAAPVLAMWILAAISLGRASPSQWSGLFLGETWHSCPLLIAMLSVPLLVAALWAMKGLAPTRLRLAGAAAGLLAGAAGALVYTLHCPELEAPFLGFWYLLGMLIPTSIGALLGPRILRW
ncbi:MAG TPA: DUF1109 domain-containing protein [Burkholderiales bacterium]|nr:DUF1109 domain-containing protein [Burkholderiales bacterium]